METAKIVGEKAKQAARGMWEATKGAAHDIKETVSGEEKKMEADDRGELLDDEEREIARNKDEI